MTHSIEYNGYIQSKRWAKRRVLYFSTHEKRCRACGSRDKIHLHHHTYTRMGHEHDDDLVPLCEPCHSAVHQLHRDTGGSLTSATRRYLALNHSALRPKRSRKKPKQSRNPNRRRPRRAVQDRVSIDVIGARLGVSKTSLRQQGYHRAVPVTTVAQWLRVPPYWTSAESVQALSDLVPDELRYTDRDRRRLAARQANP